MLGFWPCYACWDDSQDTAYQNVPLQFICVTMHDRLYSACQTVKRLAINGTLSTLTLNFLYKIM